MHSLHCYINAGKSTENLYFRVYGTSTGICCIFFIFFSCLVCYCHLFKFHDYFQLNKITRTSSNFNFINTSRQVEVYLLFVFKMILLLIFIFIYKQLSHLCICVHIIKYALLYYFLQHESRTVTNPFKDSACRYNLLEDSARC